MPRDKGGTKAVAVLQKERKDKVDEVPWNEGETKVVVAPRKKGGTNIGDSPSGVSSGVPSIAPSNSPSSPPTIVMFASNACGTGTL